MKKIIIIFLILISVFYNLYSQKNKSFKVWVERLNFRENPSFKSKVIGVIKQNEEVIYLNEKSKNKFTVDLYGIKYTGVWVKIKYDEKIGWVFSKALFSSDSSIYDFYFCSVYNNEKTLIPVTDTIKNPNNLNKAVSINFKQDGSDNYEYNIINADFVKKEEDFYYYNANITKDTQKCFLINDKLIQDKKILNFEQKENNVKSSIITKIEEIKKRKVKNIISVYEIENGSIFIYVEFEKKGVKKETYYRTDFLFSYILYDKNKFSFYDMTSWIESSEIAELEEMMIPHPVIEMILYSKKGYEIVLIEGLFEYTGYKYLKQMGEILYPVKKINTSMYYKTPLDK